jgi:hypothetical protein
MSRVESDPAARWMAAGHHVCTVQDQPRSFARSLNRSISRAYVQTQHFLIN